MNIFIIFITIAVYALLIAWTWHNLGGIEKSKKGGIISFFASKCVLLPQDLRTVTCKTVKIISHEDFTHRTFGYRSGEH